jgi:uncharacterized protein DUF6665
MPHLGRFSTPADLLAYEIVQEQAAALGRLGRGLESALAELREFDVAHPQSAASSEERQARRTLVAAASHALWMFVVQREACGLRESRSLMRDYKVPAEVQERMGVFPATRP